MPRASFILASLGIIVFILLYVVSYSRSKYSSGSLQAPPIMTHPGYTEEMDLHYLEQVITHATMVLVKAASSDGQWEFKRIKAIPRTPDSEDSSLSACLAQGNAAWANNVGYLLRIALLEAQATISIILHIKGLDFSPYCPDLSRLARIREYEELWRKEYRDVWHKQSNKDVGPSMGTDIWSVLFEMDLLLSMLNDEGMYHNRYREALRALSEYLSVVQLRNGGYTYAIAGTSNPGVGRSVTVLTALCLLYLSRLRDAAIQVDMTMLQAAARAVKSAYRDGRGGYAYYSDMDVLDGEEGEKEILGRSVLCALALHEYNRNNDSYELMKVMLERYINKAESLMGIFGREGHEGGDRAAAYYYHFGLYYATIAALNIRGSEKDEYLRRLVRILMKTRTDDGWFTDGTCHTQLYQTAFGVRLLSEVIKYCRERRKQH
ncbi:MAG: hypothetical protein ABIN58_05795 [candidate division WOR-3 bacterium]